MYSDLHRNRNCNKYRNQSKFSLFQFKHDCATTPPVGYTFGGPSQKQCNYAGYHNTNVKNHGQGHVKGSTGQGWMGTIYNESPEVFGHEFHIDDDPSCEWKRFFKNCPKIVNSYEKANTECGPYCPPDVCKEYGDALERYYQNREKGIPCKKPINPRYSNCMLK